MSAGGAPALARLAHKIFAGGRLLRAWELKGGISAGMTALEVELPGGALRRIIARIPPGQAPEQQARAAAWEYRVLGLARGLGLPVQAPLLIDLHGEFLSAPGLVIEYIEGAPDFSPADRQGFLRRLAAQLASIHAARLPTGAADFLPAGDAPFAALLARAPADLDESLAEGRIRRALSSAWPIPRRAAPALLHGDYWPGNILWQGERLAAVIDWEDAAIGDPLIDLAVARLDLATIFDLQAARDFTRCYLERSPALDTACLPYWDLCAALRFIRLASPDLAGWAAFFHPYGRADITGETIRASYAGFVAAAFGEIHSPRGPV